MEPLAITRAISPALAQCELTHLARAPIDLERARQQHGHYVATLRELGLEVIELEASADHPDCVFVEDTAVVFKELAVMTRPGASSRRGELPAIEAALAPHRTIARIEGPGTVDGGDVLVLGKRVFVGISTRTNAEGIAQLSAVLQPHGYAVTGLEVRDCLHLKSAATALDDGTAIINPAMLDPALLAGISHVAVDPSEPFAANVVRAAGRVLHGAEFPRTTARIQAAGFDVVPVASDELAKAEGALTCCSLLLSSGSGRH